MAIPVDLLWVPTGDRGSNTVLCPLEMITAARLDGQESIPECRLTSSGYWTIYANEGLQLGLHILYSLDYVDAPQWKHFD